MYTGKQPIVAIHHTDVPIHPEEGSSNSKSALLSSLLTASGSRSSIHLTMHPCSLLSHLHYIYGIENVGQDRYHTGEDDQEIEVDVRVYQYLDLLHNRGWGNPLVQSDQQESHDEESYGGREYDSPSSSRVILDLLGCSSKSSQHGSASGRCVVEHALRGVNKSNKRSDASKIVRGLEGLKRDASGKRSLTSTPVSEVLRIKARTVKGIQKDDNKVGSRIEGGWLGVH